MKWQKFYCQIKSPSFKPLNYFFGAVGWRNWKSEKAFFITFMAGWVGGWLDLWVVGLVGGVCMAWLLGIS